MTDTADALARANEAIRLLERQLQAHTIAEHHPRWTTTGELVLIGDNGSFGRPAGDPTEWTVGQVVAIDHTGTEIRLLDGTTQTFARCAALISRSKFPKS